MVFTSPEDNIDYIISPSFIPSCALGFLKKLLLFSFPSVFPITFGLNLLLLNTYVPTVFSTLFKHNQVLSVFCLIGEMNGWLAEAHGVHTSKRRLPKAYMDSQSQSHIARKGPSSFTCMQLLIYPLK